MKQLNKKESKKFFKKRPKRQQQIYLVLENIQYARNVAGVIRTTDAAGVKKLFLTGISHKPPFGKDLVKASRHKEKSVNWEYVEKTEKVINKLRKQGFTIIAIEVTDQAIPLEQLADHVSGLEKVCFVAGNEVYGVVNKTLSLCDSAVYIPMFGKGASLNVGSSVAVVLYSI